MADRLGELKTVHVSASVDYGVVIGAGLLGSLDTLVRPFCAGKKVVLVSDDEVFPRYGSAAISRAAESFGISQKGTAARIEKMLRRYGLPTELDFARDDMLDAMLSDKKSDGSIDFALIVPERIGRCRIENAGAAELCEWLKAGGIK